MLAIQIILLVFFLFAWSRVLKKYRSSEIKLKELIIWSVFWLVAGAVVLSPNSTNMIAGIVGIGRGADLVVYISLALLFYILFRIFYRLEKIEKNITKITRELALKDNEKKE
jgi:hypothetical protein